MKTKLASLAEIFLVYVVIRMISAVLRLTGVIQWELDHLGWSYVGMFVFVCIPTLVIWLTRRNWTEYGVSLADWTTNLDIGIKAYLVRFISVGALIATLMLGIGYANLTGGLLISITEVFAIALMLWILMRQKTVQTGTKNLVITALILLFPILVGFMMNRLTLVVVSTVVWQFIFSGFGEEIVWRGYVQSRLNQAFGRPMRMFGVQFGAGLIVTSLLFGFFHAFNTYDPEIGLSSLSWGWALFTTFGGLFFGILREKTGSLLAPGIAHGLPDAVGEALGKIFGWI